MHNAPVSGWKDRCEGLNYDKKTIMQILGIDLLKISVV